MQMESLIPFIILIGIIEMIVSGSWQALYFKIGVPIYKKSLLLTNPPKLSSEELSERFKAGIFNPILFKQLSPHELIFRESFFSFRLMNYTPVMHGSIQYKDGELKITGMANWFALAFLLSFIITGSDFGHDLEYSLLFMVFPIGIFALLYFIQMKRFNKIYSYIAKANGKNTNTVLHKAQAEGDYEQLR